MTMQLMRTVIIGVLLDLKRQFLSSFRQTTTSFTLALVAMPVTLWSSALTSATREKPRNFDKIAGADWRELLDQGAKL